MHAHVLKAAWVSAHARNHVICLRCLKCLITIPLVDVDLPYWTSKVEHIVAFTAIFSNIWHHGSIRWPRFPIRVQNFGDFATFSVDYCILYAECPPYFYFRFVWLTDLESIPHASTPTSIIPTKFEVDMTIHCRVITFFVCWYVTWPRDLDLLTFNSYRTWQVTCPILPPFHQVWKPYAYSFMCYEL